MPETHHLAFKKEYPELSFRLTTEVDTFDVTSGSGIKGNTVTALWDTGATISAITPAVAKSLSLIPINRVKVNGVNNTSLADVVKISIELPNHFILSEINVMVCNLIKGVDMLIGMDIIRQGDFSISNWGGKTLFSFAMPPFKDKTDHYEKALEVNKYNNIQR
jgi:predicted aspartyl protease